MAKTEFFYKLSDKLDELFPKGDKRRGDALVLNAFANILLEEEKKKVAENILYKVTAENNGDILPLERVEDYIEETYLHQEEE